MQAIAHIVKYLNCDSSDRGVFSEYSQSRLTAPLVNDNYSSCSNHQVNMETHGGSSC
jgi:hypothetical protein